MNDTVSDVCFVGIYGHNQDDVLREGLQESDVSLTEVSYSKRTVSEAISERRLPAYTVRATANWLSTLPSWLFPLPFLGTIALHTLLIWSVMLLNQKAIRQCDVLVVPHMGDTSVLAVKPIAVLLDTPIVYFSHNGMYYPLIENREMYDADTVSARLIYHLDRLTHWMSDWVIVFSEASKREFVERYGFPEERYETIYITAIESNFDKSLSTDGIKSYDVLYWGNFHPHHGPEAMAEVAELTPEYEFGFVGESDKRGQIIERVEELGAENVEFTGYVELEDLVRYIKSAGVVFGPVGDNPQSEFTIGTKVAEAAYLEKAIIVGQQPATEEVLAHRESAYLTEPGDPEALAVAVREVLSDEELQTTLERGAFNAYEEYFSTERTTERFLRITEECLDDEVRYSK